MCQHPDQKPLYNISKYMHRCAYSVHNICGVCSLPSYAHKKSMFTEHVHDYACVQYSELISIHIAYILVKNFETFRVFPDYRLECLCIFEFTTEAFNILLSISL